jgi:LPS-assembly protein
MRQTLEPRLLYVRTPYRSQDLVPNFDSAPRDFNFDSIYADNQFTGVDRVNDANLLTFGAVSRWIRPDSGDEVLRLGAVQRMQFTEQLITPDGSPPSKQRFSDLLLLGAVHMSEFWWADGTLQYDPENNRTQRSVLRARYSPGPFRTVSVAYRLARDQSEQAEVAWQWPLFGGRKSGGSGCSGSWYSAGRVQYSMRDRRVTDSVMSMEYDAGCWVMRMGVQRLSTGLSQTNTRLMLQLELVGLSQLGSNALHVLKDNIPGYRALSSERSTFPSSSND